MPSIPLQAIPDQPYPELRQVLATFVGEISGVLKENLLGFYLVGSLATGDFDLDSDVDFLVVTRTEMTEAGMQPLQAIQERMHAIGCYPAQHLEGSYISLSDLNDWSTVGQKPLFYFDNGSTTLERATHDNQWHVRWVLRQRGIPLLGPKPATILPEIPIQAMLDEVKAAMARSLEIFAGEIDRPLSFCNSRFGQSFFVLTFCRMLHSLHTATVQSKKAGAAWAKDFVDPQWKELIDQAWQERQGVRFMEKIHQRAEQGLLGATLDFMKYALALKDAIEFKAG